MKQYYILSVAGSAGLFLTSIFAQYLGSHGPARISKYGDCHDLGNGTWNSTNLIELSSDYLKPCQCKKPLLVCHSTDLTTLRRYNPKIKIVLINFEPDDAERISYFRTIKAHTLRWNESEYKKLAGPDWPPYSPTNIQDSDMIRNELIQMQIPHTLSWLESTKGCSNIDYVVQFKTIMSGDINRVVADILEKPLRPDLQKFIKEYQTINKQQDIR